MNVEGEQNAAASTSAPGNNCFDRSSAGATDHFVLSIRVKLLLHLRLLLLLLLLLPLLNRQQQQQLAQQQAPIRQPPHWFSSQLLTRMQPHSVKALLSPPRNATPFKCAAAVRLVTGSVITPFFITPIITTPSTPSCGCAGVLSHPVVYHTPFVDPASRTLSPGLHNIPHPPQDTTPAVNSV